VRDSEGEDRQIRTDRAAKTAEWDCNNGTGRTGQIEQDKQNGKAGIGQAEQDRQTEQAGKDC
jgi:hypothetical protein